MDNITTNFTCKHFDRLSNVSNRFSTVERATYQVPVFKNFGGVSPAPYVIQIHAIITADTNGQHSSTQVHPSIVTDTEGYKYNIEPNDVKLLVDGANQSYNALNVQFSFDPQKNVEYINDTFLNRDTLSPNWLFTSRSVFYRSNDNEIYELWISLDPNDTQSWKKQNITKSSNAPSAIGIIYAYLSGFNTVKHVLYRSSDGHVHELFSQSDYNERNMAFNGGIETDWRQWSHNDLTIKANAPLAAGDPVGYTSFDAQSEGMDVQHVVYRGVDGHIHELWAGATWNYNNLTAAANAPLAAGDPYGYVTYNPQTGKMDVQHVVYRGVDGHIHELWAGATWNYNNLTAAANAPLAAGNPKAYTTSCGSVQHVIYKDHNGHIHELFAGNTWNHNDLTSKTNAPIAAGDPFGYTTDDFGFGVPDDQHIVYRGIDNHVHELFTIDSWYHNDLTSSAGAPTTISDPIAYTTNSKQRQFVIFTDPWGNVQELLAGKEKWLNFDLTATTNCPAASQNVFALHRAEDTLCSIMRNIKARAYKGQIVVYFRYGWQGWSNAVDDFVIIPSIWNPNDPSLLAHEIGHYLHLPHTFGSSIGEAVAIQNIKSYVEDLALQQNNNIQPLQISQQIIGRGLEVIDIDYPTITDTPPEPFNEIDKDVDVTFSTGQVHTYQIRPDIQNIMNYLNKGGQPGHFSDQQKLRMRDALENRNRQHLIR